MKTIFVYNYSELSAESKETARNWYREKILSQESLWSETVIEDAQQCFALCGFDIEGVYFSGFSSQGSGACFEGVWQSSKVKDTPSGQVSLMGQHAPKDTELHRIAAECERIHKLFPFVYLKVKHSGHYYHENCTDFTVSITDNEDNETDTKEAAEAEKDLIEVSKDAMRWIYKKLEASSDFENSDERISNLLEESDYHFLADGTKVDIED